MRHTYLESSETFCFQNFALNWEKRYLDTKKKYRNGFFEPDTNACLFSINVVDAPLHYYLTGVING